MDNRAIGIFDSGLGGLTALKAFRELLPDENIIYFADSGRVPYGGRSAAQLRIMTVQDLDFVASFSVKAIIAACGTVSSTAPDVLEAYPLPVFGVVKAAIREMSAVPGTAPLGVIATEASIKAGTFKREIGKRCPGREILALGCPEFVPLIESGHTESGDPLLRRAIERALSPLKAAGISALLLGCTHYGIIGDAIGEYLGEGVSLVSAAQCAAREARDYLIAHELQGGTGELRFCTSGSPEDFRAAAPAVFGGAEIYVEQVPVMEAREI